MVKIILFEISNGDLEEVAIEELLASDSGRSVH
jgi:hypothetical protein